MIGFNTALIKRISAFWLSVQIGDEDECWPWTGYVNDDGYGMFYFAGKMKGAHELAVSFTTGETRSPGLDTCHSCNTPICCNPHHLRFDTRLSNVRDMFQAGRNRNGALTHDDVRMIRLRLEAGAIQQDLARDYSVSEATIHNIKTGKRYAHVK